MPKQCKKGAKIACIVTGKTTYFAEMFLEKKIAKYGSVEDFAKFFVCNEAKRLLKQGLSVEQIREQLGCDSNLPSVDIEILFKRKLIKKKKEKRGVDAFTEDQKQQFKEDYKKRVEEYQQDVKEYGPFGAWVREHSFTSNGLGTCLRPDIYLNNDKHCANCECFEFCLCRIWGRRTRS